MLAGLLIAAYPLTFGASAQLTCRGSVMQPGDVCPKADGSKVQTYEQRVQARRNAAPVVVGLGLAVAGFGVALLTGARGSWGVTGHTSKTHAASGDSAQAMRRSTVADSSGSASTSNQSTSKDSSSPTTASPET